MFIYNNSEEENVNENKGIWLWWTSTGPEQCVGLTNIYISCMNDKCEHIEDKSERFLKTKGSF